MRLGRQELKQLGLVDRPTYIYDDDLKGFGLRVMPPSTRSREGTRSWIVEYRPGFGGRRVTKRRVVIGRADVLTPEQARQIAKTTLAEVRLGADPAASRAARRQARTLGELSTLYFAATNVDRKPRTRELYAGLWRIYIEPAFDRMTPAEISGNAVGELRRNIGEVRGRKATANRVIILIRHFYRWAQEQGDAPQGKNPASGFTKFDERKRQRYLSTDEFRRLGRVLDIAATVGLEWTPDPAKKTKHAPKDIEARRVKLSDEVAAAIRLLILTGARLREILHLEWAHIDLERRLLLLPDSKTGAKAIVLGGAATEVLQTLQSKYTNEGEHGDRDFRPPSRFVFPGNDLKQPRADLKRPWLLLKKHADLHDVRLHDLRHSFASIGAGAGLGLHMIGHLLGHRDSSTTARYAHLDASPVREATDLIGGRILAALGNGNRD